MPRRAIELAGEVHLVELFLRFAERLERARKNHAPRKIGVPTPELAADEVAETPESEPDRHDRRDEIDDVEENELVAPRPPEHGEQDAEEAAVERHAAFPDAK